MEQMLEKIPWTTSQGKEERERASSRSLAQKTCREEQQTVSTGVNKTLQPGVLGGFYLVQQVELRHISDLRVQQLVGDVEDPLLDRQLHTNTQPALTQLMLHYRWGRGQCTPPPSRQEASRSAARKWLNVRFA